AAVAAGSADDVPLTGHPVTDGDVAHERADLHDLAVELVAGDERGDHGRRGPIVPAADVQVGSADAGTQHPDDHVSRVGDRIRSIDELEPGSCGGLEKCL